MLPNDCKREPNEGEMEVRCCQMGGAGPKMKRAETRWSQMGATWDQIVVKWKHLESKRASIILIERAKRN